MAEKADVRWATLLPLPSWFAATSFPGWRPCCLTPFAQQVQVPKMHLASSASNTNSFESITASDWVR